MAAKKNSLVANINRRKKAGTSRPKSRSTISTTAYQKMQAGWPKSGSAKVSKNAKKPTKESTKTTKKKADKVASPAGRK